MALSNYMRRTQRLIRDQKQAQVNPADLIDYINEARNQIAGEGECIRYIGEFSLTANVRVYPFANISLAGATGIQGILNARTTWVQIGLGQVWLRLRPFEWMSLYELNNPVPTIGQPKIWAQYAQGGSGSLYFSPIPDMNYTVNADCVCYPSALALDTDPEAIPQLWTEAVPFYAAYLAMLSMETGGGTDEAQKMFERYKDYVQRARRASTPGVMPGIYPQNPSQPAQGQG